MADPLYLRQYAQAHWDALSANEKQALLLKVETLAQEAARTLLRNEPAHVVKLGQGYTYMWDLVPE